MGNLLKGLANYYNKTEDKFRNSYLKLDFLDQNSRENIISNLISQCIDS